MERRSFHSNYQAEGRRLVGYASVFDTPYRISERGKTFNEVIKPGAFARALASGADIIATFNHNPDNLLARTQSGTLRLSEDAHGLKFELDLPDTQLGEDLRKLVARGDVAGASFAFRIRPNGERMVPGAAGQLPTRELSDLFLYELGPVAMPASPTTSVGVRSASFDLMRMAIALAEKS